LCGRLNPGILLGDFRLAVYPKHPRTAGEEQQYSQHRRYRSYKGPSCEGKTPPEAVVAVTIPPNIVAVPSNGALRETVLRVLVDRKLQIGNPRCPVSVPVKKSACVGRPLVAAPPGSVRMRVRTPLMRQKRRGFPPGTACQSPRAAPRGRPHLRAVEQATHR